MNGQKSEFPDEDVKIYWILSYMQTGSAKTWRDYVVALMYKGQQSFSTSDELLKEIDRKFGDTDKRTTQSLKIRTIQQEISRRTNMSRNLKKQLWKLAMKDILWLWSLNARSTQVYGEDSRSCGPCP